MARPLKDGVEYFPLDTGFLADKKVRLLKGEFGSRGVVILLATLCRIYSENGYYASLDQDDCILLSDEIGCGVTPELVGQVVQGCVKRSLFDEGVLNAFGVLTSPGIQRRYLRAVAKRDDIEFTKEYWLLDVDDKKDVPLSIRNKITFKSLKATGNPDKTTGNPDKTIGNHIKESKVDESRVNENKVDVVADACTGNNIAEYLDKAFIRMTYGNWETLHEQMDTGGIGNDMLMFAIDQTVAIGSNRFSTLQQILDSWILSRIKTLEAAKAHEARRRGNGGRNYAKHGGTSEEDNPRRTFDGEEILRAD